MPHTATIPSLAQKLADIVFHRKHPEVADITSPSDGANSMLEGGEHQRYDIIRASLKKIMTQLLLNYAAVANKQHTYIYTIMHSSAPIDVKEIYAGSTFLENDKSITEGNLIGRLISGERFLVTGTAGSGKSMFLKNSCCDLIRKPYWTHIPILVELRHVNFEKGENAIFHFILKNVFDNHPVLSIDDIIRFINAGQILLMLDAVDEIPEYALTIFVDVVNFFIRTRSSGIGARLPSGLIVTTRPNSRFFYMFPDLNKVSIASLSDHNARILVRKLPFQEEIKKKFIEIIDNKALEKKKEFIGNPLLLTLLVMLYAQHINIPSRLNIFYEEDFAVLFHKFDATKDGFVRPSGSNLDIVDFKNLFSIFCFYSYLEQKYAFDYATIILHIKEAIIKIKKMYDLPDKIIPDQVLSDLNIRTCLIKHDAGSYEFTHRTFQEFFAAYHITHDPVLPKLDLMNYIMESRRQDETLKMIRALDPRFFDFEWALERCKSLIRSYSEQSKDILRIESVELSHDDFMFERDYAAHQVSNYGEYRVVVFLEERGEENQATREGTRRTYRRYTCIPSIDDELRISSSFFCEIEGYIDLVTNWKGSWVDFDIPKKLEGVVSRNPFVPSAVIKIPQEADYRGKDVEELIGAILTYYRDCLLKFIESLASKLSYQKRDLDNKDIRVEQILKRIKR